MKFKLNICVFQAKRTISSYRLSCTSVQLKLNHAVYQKAISCKTELHKIAKIKYERTCICYQHSTYREIDQLAISQPMIAVMTQIERYDQPFD